MGYCTPLYGVPAQAAKDEAVEAARANGDDMAQVSDAELKLLLKGAQDAARVRELLEVNNVAGRVTAANLRTEQLVALVTAGNANEDRVYGRLDALGLDLEAGQLAELAELLGLPADQVTEAVHRVLGDDTPEPSTV